MRCLELDSNWRDDEFMEEVLLGILFRDSISGICRAQQLKIDEYRLYGFYGRGY
jgi:hypothetical protein